MATNLQNLEYNQTFPYRGGTAKFISKDDKSGKAWIEFNGQCFRVDYKDIFGINYAEQMQERNLAGIDDRIATAQSNYDEYCAKIEAAKLTCKTEGKKQGFFAEAMSRILGGRKDKTELTGAKATEYAELEYQYNTSTKVGDRASSDILTYSIWAFDEALYKHDLYCQRSVAEHMLG